MIRKNAEETVYLVAQALRVVSPPQSVAIPSWVRASLRGKTGWSGKHWREELKKSKSASMKYVSGIAISILPKHRFSTLCMKTEEREGGYQSSKEA